MLAELYTTKVNNWDKGGLLLEVSAPLLGDSFLFSKADAVWKAKRQACSHAFYKDKLVGMVEVMKEILDKRFTLYIKEIEENEQKKHTIDISTEILDTMARNIITVAFGEDINDELVEIKVRHTPLGSDFYTKKVRLSFAI